MSSLAIDAQSAFPTLHDTQRTAQLSKAMLSSSSPQSAAPVIMTTPTPSRPTVRTASVPPPSLSFSQSLSLPLADDRQATATLQLSPTPSASFPAGAVSPRELKSPPPAAMASALAPPTPIPSYMQTTKAYATRSPQPPNTPTRTNAVSSSMPASSSASKRTSRSTTRASDRSRSRPRQPNPSNASTTTFAPAPETPAPPALPPPPAPQTPLDPLATTAISDADSPPLTVDFPCASCRAHYTSSASTRSSPPAWSTAAHHPHKLHRHLLDLQITNDTLAVLNADLQATVAQQARFIAQLEEHVSRLALKVGKDEAELVVAHMHDDQEAAAPSAQESVHQAWYEPVSEDKIQDHHMLLARMCDRTHRMLFDARRAVNRNRGDMESVSAEEGEGEELDECGSMTSVEFGSDGDEDDEVSEIEANVVPKVVMPTGAAARGRQLSTTSSIASSTATASGGQLHALVKSLAYHIHLLDSTPPPPPAAADLLLPTTTTTTTKTPRRPSSSTVSSSRLPARSPSPLSLTRTPSGLGVLGLGLGLGLGAVLDLAPSHHHAPAASAGDSGAAAAAAARKHQLEQCLVIQRCKDTVMQLCAETGVPMGEVREMVVDAQMHVATTSSMPGSPTTTPVTSASRLASPAVASRHPSGSSCPYPNPRGAGSTGHSVDEDLVDIRSDASSTRSNYSRVSSTRSFLSSDAGGGGGGARSSVLGPNASASALGRAGGGMVYPAGLSLEEKYRMHLAYQQQAAQSVADGNVHRPGSLPRVVLQEDTDEEPGPRSVLSGSGGGTVSSVSSPTLLPDSTSLVSGVSGGRVIRIKHAHGADSASIVSGGSSSPSVPSGAATGTDTGGTPSRVTSVLSGFLSSTSSAGNRAVGSRVNVNGGSELGSEIPSPQGSSAGRPRSGPGSMVARAIKVRTWMG